MEVRKRKLSILQLIGYEEVLPFNVSQEELCLLIYELGQKFITDMLDVVYFDGPIYFKTYPFAVVPYNKALIFSTFGNEVSRINADTGFIQYKEEVLIDSMEYSTFTCDYLQEYYNILLEKYDKKHLECLAVYHVLRMGEDRLYVDAYSSWEVD
ncbi:hypothetical protein [Streptococcus acidominimus]|uniref:Uncharacterized protein n=1 Tax=Streptococcus acidominimus TaxID=1326 RepID=A0A4Y9FNZ9_STRAI|nr:hypothetical protein [Streptococcus acidominimus]MBF0818796.1 hypothetical protein [Streptococcus acidominimus]MBF0839207.1 hypothetical protein [Streptococcus acidominimus]MBF0849152.1 hypothetical protein [Streptococcus danieliae]TFU30746.1 hypothetical protein E4U01_04925 [Streptococcus acidominimus]